MKNPNHTEPGSSIKVDPIRSKAAIENIKKILMHQPRNYCLFTLGINTAYRANELLSIQIEQVDYLKAGDELDLKQKKTKAYRRVKINKNAVTGLKLWLKASEKLAGPLFYSQKGTVLAVPSVIRLVKGWCASVGLKGNYGSHTLRKTGALAVQKSDPDSLTHGSFWSRQSAADFSLSGDSNQRNLTNLRSRVMKKHDLFCGQNNFKVVLCVTFECPVWPHHFL